MESLPKRLSRSNQTLMRHCGEIMSAKTAWRRKQLSNLRFRRLSHQPEMTRSKRLPPSPNFRKLNCCPITAAGATETGTRATTRAIRLEILREQRRTAAREAEIFNFPLRFFLWKDAESTWG